MKRLLLLTLAALAHTLAWAVEDADPGETSPDDALYRIEVLVFANSNPVDETIEQWFPPRSLPVPERLQVLVPLAVATPADAGDDLAEAVAATDSVDGDSPTIGETTAEPTTDRALFHELADTSPAFAEAAERMRRSRYYRVLALKAWEQALPKGAEPVAVVIRGGEAFGEHNELEGTLSIRRERYLHAHARLWLSRFSEYTGETIEQDWPALPALPRYVAPEPELPETVTDSGDSDIALDADLPEDDAMPYDDWVEYDWFSPARPDRIVLLDQRRKLRSNELHHIDHPLFGVLLRVVPVEAQPTGD